MISPTPAQARVFRALKALIGEGVSPSYQELCDAAGIKSKGHLSLLLDGLRLRGLITFDHSARSIRVVGEMEGLLDRSTADLRALRDRIDEILKARAQ